MQLRRELPFLDFAPIVSISAKTGQRVGRVLELAVDVWGERRKRVSTGELNRLIARGGRSATPPAIVHGPALQDLLRDPGRRRAARRSCSSPRDAGLDPLQLPALPREPAARAFGFDGTPIRLVFREQVREKRPKRSASRRR